jgi:integrase
MPSVAKARPARKSTTPASQFSRHTRGWWCKRVKGKLRYFGKIADDPKAERAAEQWADQKADLLAGRKPRAKLDLDGYLLADLVTDFAKAKESLVKSGELSPRSLTEYVAAGQLLIDQFGEHRRADDITPEQFAELRATLSAKWGVVRVAKFVQLIRTIFRFAHYGNKKLPAPVVFGELFRKPSKKRLKQHRDEKRQANGERMFTADEIKAMLGKAGPALKAMLMLGANCGFGATDCSALPIGAIDLAGGWANFSRPKTAVDRRCPLWPETIEALQAWMNVRPEARPGLERRVFITAKRDEWVKANGDDAVAKEIAKLLDALNIKRAGRGMYALRHGLETIGREACDRDALDCIMGHAAASSDMGEGYNERRPSDERLRKVSDHVHRWLFGGTRCDFANGKL